MVVAPAPFKAALSAPDSARAIAAGLRLAGIGATLRELPVADGGEGTADALIASLGGRRRGGAAVDPLGRPIDAGIAELPGRLVVVELAAAAGYELLAGDERDPEATSTRGVGMLVRSALDLGAERIVIGVGGSATNDAGLGMAVALGARATDADGVELAGRGADLARVATLDLSGLDARLATAQVELAVDVENPFCGPDGAAHAFGTQKGASPDAVARLDAGLGSFAERLRDATGVDVTSLAGAGAAGGAAGGLAAMLGARIRSGAELVVDAAGLDDALVGAGLCVTGEGRLDETTLRGKAPAEVASRCRAAHVPCVALCGEIGLGPRAVREMGLAAAFTIGRRRSTLDQARASTEADLAAAGAAVGALYRALRSG